MRDFKVRPVKSAHYLAKSVDQNSKPMTGVFLLSKERKEYTEERDVTMEMDVGIMHMQVREHQGLPGATRRWKRQGKILP